MFDRLADILDQGKTGITAAVNGCRLLGFWPEVVDERIQKNAEAVKIRNKILYVSTSTSTWAQELSMLKREIIEKFNHRAGEEAISDIKFKCNAGGF